MNPACERFVPLILRSADGTLSAASQAELDAHVERCPDCRDALREQAAVSRLLGDVGMQPVSPGFAARVRQRAVPEAGLLGLFPWRAWTLRLAPLAAVIALLAWYPSSSEGVASQSPTLPTALEDWAGSQAQVAGGVLISDSPNRDALLAAALGETSR